MKLDEWPELERPRERMMKVGAQFLSDAELVSILLGTGRKGENVYEIAMRLLNRFGGLQGIDTALIRDLTASYGIGPAKAAMLKSALELGRRTMGAVSSRSSIRSSRDLFLSFEPKFHGLDREVFYCAFLDSGLRLQEQIVLSTGGTSSCLVDTRLLLRDALSRGACSVALAHNHPSGELRPSTEDKTLTENISISLETVGLRLLDHLIICEGGYYSFADSGLIRTRPPAPVPQGGSPSICDPQAPWSPCRP